MAETLYASFADASLAERAVGALLDHGVRGEDISLIACESYGRGRAAAEDTASEAEVEDPVLAGKSGLTTTTPGDAAAGALTGAGIGLGVGTVAAVASLIFPGYGLVLGGGALAIAIGGAAASTAAGAVAGGIFGFLKDMGVPDHAAARYQEAIERGGALIAIRVPSGDADRAMVEQILSKYNPVQVSAYGMSVV
jgi:hypothetical protein